MEITFREFRQNLAKYLKLIEEGQVIRVRKIWIGKVEQACTQTMETCTHPIETKVQPSEITVYTGDKESVYTMIPVKASTEIKEEDKIFSAGEDIWICPVCGSDDPDHDCKKCNFCGEKAEYQGMDNWDTGQEEYTCSKCVRKSFPTDKAFKNAISKLKKL